MNSEPLLIPNLERLRRKIAKPAPLLADLLARFRQRLSSDKEFRTGNIHLEALLGNAEAIQESKEIVIREAQGYRTRGAEDNAVEHHTWCVAPTPMRMAVYYNWQTRLGSWTEAESIAVAEGLLHFAYEHAAAVLRGRAPSADNQSFSLALCCAVTGYVFRELPAVKERAQSLYDFGMRRLALVLGLSPQDGYLGEGSTYQSAVVSPLTMWATAFLMQIDGPEAASRRWSPGGASLLDILRVEGLLGSPGSLMPGWDHYGWQPKINLSPIALHASLTGDADALRDARDVWDRSDYLAWGHDDRMWSLIYWPDRLDETHARPALSGWSLPHTAATIDDRDRRARLMLAWDENSPWIQAIGRAQANPNHVLYELDRKPIFGDGSASDTEGFLGVTPQAIASPLSEAQRELIARQYGSIDRWANAQHGGLIGAANTVVVDDEAGYFPLGAKHGRLCFEDRATHQHVVTAESVDYFAPRYDLTRARRTIAMNANGVCWIVDDYRAASVHRFTWQLYLRPGCALSGNHLNITTSDGQELTLAWIPVDAAATLERVEKFPAAQASWPDHGSERLWLATRGERAVFVTCLVPWRATSMEIHALGENTWRAKWDGGSDTLILNKAIDPLPADPREPVPESICDLDHAPFALSDEPNRVLLEVLEHPDPANWRRTTIAMQSLTLRNVSTAMPLIDRLLRDPSQRYHVHSVAAWCLGRAKHRPSLEYLRYLVNSPETNTALHARWSVDSMR